MKISRKNIQKLSGKCVFCQNKYGNVRMLIRRFSIARQSRSKSVNPFVAEKLWIYILEIFREFSMQYYLKYLKISRKNIQKFSGKCVFYQKKGNVRLLRRRFSLARQYGLSSNIISWAITAFRILSCESTKCQRLKNGTPEKSTHF